MKLFLYTNTFTHEGKTLMSASIGIRRGEIDCAGMIGLPMYLHADNMYEGAMGLMSLALSTEALLENLGHTVEIEDVLKSITDIVDHLRGEYAIRMIYRTFDDLTKAVVDGMDRMPSGITPEAMRLWLLDQPDLVELARLCKVYLDAKSNPPEGIIGVGCITYAEEVLQKNQH